MGPFSWQLILIINVSIIHQKRDPIASQNYHFKQLQASDDPFNENFYFLFDIATLKPDFFRKADFLVVISYGSTIIPSLLLVLLLKNTKINMFITGIFSFVLDFFVIIFVCFLLDKAVMLCQCIYMLSWRCSSGIVLTSYL